MRKCVIWLYASDVIIFHMEADGEAHLEANLALLAAEAGQHEEDEGEETRERDGHHSQGWWPGQFTQWSAICRTQSDRTRVLAVGWDSSDQIVH